MKKKGCFGRILLILLIVILIAVAGGLTFLLAGKEKALNLTVDNVALDAIPDGTYEGSYSGFRWSNTVEVTVKDHMITDITVTDPQAVMTEQTRDALIHSVINEQRVNVDAVTGATADRNAFLKAVEQALKSAAQD
jgi:uncharacterized protein with FMN-binding domain